MGHRFPASWCSVGLLAAAALSLLVTPLGIVVERTRTVLSRRTRTTEARPGPDRNPISRNTFRTCVWPLDAEAFGIDFRVRVHDPRHARVAGHVEALRGEEYPVSHWAEP